MDEQNETFKPQQPPTNITMETAAPIFCPHCNNRERLAFVASCRKALFARIAEIILSVILSILIVMNLKNLLSVSISPFENEEQTTTSQETESDNVFISAFVVLAVFIGICRIARTNLEAKTHVQVICKDCGHQWEIL